MNKIFLIVLFLSLHFHGISQNGINPVVEFKCPSDELIRKSIATDEAYREKNQNFERLYVQAAQNGRQINDTNIYEIPIVIHIIYSGEAVGTPNNLSDATIQNYIQLTNNRLRHTSGMAFANNPFSGADARIKLCIAKTDTNGRFTTGIIRHNNPAMASAASLATFTNYCISIRWNPEKYYNLFLISDSPADYPFSGVFSPSFDGTAYESAIFWDGLICHETGHYFSLHHNFQNGCVNNNCLTDGDEVCDTPPKSAPSFLGATCSSPGNNCLTDDDDLSANNPFRPVANGGLGDRLDGLENYMDYTGSCWQAFTQGQVVRMRTNIEANRMALASSDKCNIPAKPEINFELENDKQILNPTDIIDCRTYRDYKYKLNISATPLVNIVITLFQSGGSMIEHTDFEITTNGDFNAPSKTIVFFANTDTGQSFTLRVYNIPVIDSLKNVKFGFTMVDSGLNALPGTIYPVLNASIKINKNSIHSDSTVVYELGNNLYSGIESPLDGRNTDKKKSQVIYKKREMIEKGIKAGPITGLSMIIFKRAPAGTSYNGFTIKMFQTAQSHLYNSSAGQFPLNDATHTVVYSSNFTPVNGWNDIEFTTPFTWDGASNIVITFCHNSTTTDTLEFTSYYSDSAYSQTIGDYIVGANTDCASPLFSWRYYLYGGKPGIKFKMLIPETQVQTSLSTKTEYLGPYGDIYFYDSLQNKVLIRIKNLSDFDYGCTQLQIDRSGNAAYPFLDNDAAHQLLGKTFNVVPSANNPEGQYEVSLYYTKQEINAWEAATGQSFGYIQMVKVDKQIADVSPANPSGGGFVLAVTPDKDSLGNIRSVTGLFNNGFSGFGAGVAVTNMYTFSGTGNWSDAVNWSNNSIPPAVLPLGAQIIIKPVAGGECILDTAQTILKGAVFYINPGAKFRVLGNLEVQQ